MKFLFLLCLPGDGSSVLKRVLSNPRNSMVFQLEGQERYPKKLLSSVYPNLEEEIIRDPKHYDWEGIKSHWDDLWHKTDTQKYNLAVEINRIFLQKSPMDIFRVDMLMEEFEGVKFILMTRDPYATVEGRFRKSHVKGNMIESVKLWERMAKLQLEVNKLDNVLHIRFESLCTNTDNVAQKIRDFIPEFDDFAIDPYMKFKHKHAESTCNGPIQINEGLRLNGLSYDRLGPENVDKVNKTLDNNQEWLETFNYEVR